MAHLLNVENGDVTSVLDLAEGVGFEPLRNVLFSGEQSKAAVSGTSRSTITSEPRNCPPLSAETALGSVAIVTRVCEQAPIQVFALVYRY